MRSHAPSLAVTLALFAALGGACAHGGAAATSDPSDPSVDSVLARARAEVKPVALFFHAEW